MRALRAFGLALAPLLALGCSPPPPSMLLFVFDTTRADAVSAYGHRAGTTPVADALASEGLLYARAYSQASWTLPSHATLFTGLSPDRHGMGWRLTRAPDALQTVAETLRDAGYQTFGVSENPWISDPFNMTQGFDRFVSASAEPDAVEEAVRSWLGERDVERPFFVFVNVVDPHEPHEVREETRFLPPGVTPSIARSVAGIQVPWKEMCRHRSPRPGRRAWILRGLYHQSVAAADGKLGRVRELLVGADPSLISVVTADHGEHFGEHGLVSHSFSVREELLRVPLIIVHGIPAAAPAVIDEVVSLADVAPSISVWAGLDAPVASTGRPLPTSAGGPGPQRSLVARYEDPEDFADEGEPSYAKSMRSAAALLRSECTEEWPVHGGMRALVRYPFKLIAFDRYPDELYDVDRDPGEQHDLASERPDVVAAMRAELERSAGDAPEPGPGAAPSGELPDDLRRRLRELGYLSE